MTRLNDKWFRLVGIPLGALMGHIIFYNRNITGDERFGFWTIYFISLIETVIVWESIRFVILYFRKRFPGLDQTRKRITGMLIASVLLTFVIRTLNIWFYDKTLLWGYRFPLEGYLHGVFVAVLLVIIIGGIYEGIYYFSMWHRTSLEAESLKKLHLETQLDSLKTQINPHFLFNNFGSLASLITEDQQKAVEFVEELSSVYRYLLKANEKTVTTLDEELKFIHSYYQLVKKRFANGIVIVQEIDPAALQSGIPPLTLQLLVENAIKHNAVLPDKPLGITISTIGSDTLSIVNNIQKKSSPVESGKLGLKNITNKYKLLRQPDVKIEQTEKYFKVTVPLIKTI